MDVGIRELRADLSRWVRRVSEGEEVVVTDHGRPVARLVPIGEERKIDRLIREGAITPSTHRGPRPVPDPIDGPPLSEFVIGQR